MKQHPSWLIGEEATGKSIVAKLLYYFRRVVKNLEIETRRGTSVDDYLAGWEEVFSKYKK